MSADNYWLVRKHEGKYILSMEFMSGDGYSPIDDAIKRYGLFNTLADVHVEMNKPEEYEWGNSPIYPEYGTIYNFPTRVVEEDYITQLHKLAADAIDLAANLTYWMHSDDDAILALRARKIKLEENHESK